MSEQAKFSVKGLDLYYGDFHALKDVNLDIKAKRDNCIYRTIRLWKSLHFENIKQNE